MPEITEEEAQALERFRAQEQRRRIYNKARSHAVTKLVEAHKDEYDRYMSEAS